MLRHQFPEAYKWIILWLIVAMILLFVANVLIPQSTITIA